MPIIFFYGPELEKEKKIELIKSLTESASKVTKIGRDKFTVILRHLSKDNVGVGGELISEKE